MTGPLSPNMINAGSGITPSVTGGPPPSGYYSLGVAEELLAAINAYYSVAIIGPYRSIYTVLGTLTGFGPEQTQLGLLRKQDWPAFTDAAPYSGTTSAVSPLISANAAATDNGPTPAPGYRVAYAPNTRFMTGLINANAELIMGYTSPGFTPTTARDLTRFAQIQGICAAYRVQANDQINSAANSAGLNTVFTSMNALMTGGISEINSDLQKFGQDLTDLGQLINFRFLSFLGYPSFLVRQILTVGRLLPAVYNALNTGLTGGAAGIIRTLSSGDQVLDLQIEKNIYRALGTIKGQDLQSVLELLGVTTKGLTTAADLLDPRLIFARSYGTMISPVPGGDAAITGNPVYQDLAAITTPALALANGQMTVRFGQVKDIRSSTLPVFAATVSAIEGDQGLGDVQTLSQSVPATVISAIDSSLATGTGPNGSLLLYDLIGTAAGHVHVPCLEEVTDILNSLDLSSVIEIYTYYTNLLAGVYTTGYPLGPFTTTAPLAGTTTNAILEESWRPAVNTYNGLLDTRSDTARLANATAVSRCNELWGLMCAQLNRESKNRWLAELEFDFVTSSYPDIKANARSAGLALINQLHQLGSDASEGGPGELVEKTAQTTNLGGQSVLASLREARNQQAMWDAGLGIDIQLSNKPAA